MLKLINKPALKEYSLKLLALFPLLKSDYILIFLFSFALPFSALVMPPTSANAEYRIATVDINRVLNETDESKAAREKLSKQSDQAKATIEKKKKELENKEASLKSEKVSPDSKEAELFRQEVKDFQRLVKDTEEDLKREFLRSNSLVTQKAMEAIQGYAKSNNIDLVLEKGGAGKSAVLFGTPGVDITEEIIKKIKS